MQLLTRKSIGVLSVLISAFTLGACSPTAGTPTPSAVEATATPLPAEAPVTRTPVPTETSVVSPTATVVETESPAPTAIPTEEMNDEMLADVLSVAVSGSENAYQFAVEIRSPDTGCEQYADWWEVVSEDGKLLYRRILTHSHVTEQPFTRSGGPVAVNAGTVVIVRAHMHPHGYGGAALRGSVADGFETIWLEPDFEKGLEDVDPLPSGCGF